MSIGISIGLVVLAYLLGSIPPAIWISKYAFGSDIRKHGSGNAGSTNMFRVYGARAGIATQLIDITKGILAASLPVFLVRACGQGNCLHEFSHLPMTTQSMICGLAAVIGHIYPIFAGFRGGKGINTLLGTMLIADPGATGICILVFIAVLLISKYVSLSSLTAVFTYPVFQLVNDLRAGNEIDWAKAGLGFSLFLLVAYTHRSNIRRLIKGNENKAGFLNRKRA